MILFLTSSPFLGFLMPFNDENEFILRLRRDTTGGRCALFVTSDPEDVPFTEKFAQAVQNSLFRAGIDFPRYRILDGRNKEKTEELVEEADFIILAGGHVPTQNAFFQEIGLKECMKKYRGVVMGISAGTMNCARLVYAQPELAGEAVDPAYRKFLIGLGLTDINICPHYQMLKDSILDGMRLFDDITYADSRGRRFLALPDGSYVLIRDGKAEVWGEAWQIADGKLTAFCGRDESRSVRSSIY